MILIVCRLIVFEIIEFIMERCYMVVVRVFGANVKKYRTQTGLSQEAFAEKCGLHRTYISAVEC